MYATIGASTLCLIAAIILTIYAAVLLLRGSGIAWLFPAAVALIAWALSLTL